MGQVHRVVENVYKYALLAVAALALAIIFFMSLVATCYMSSDDLEITYFCKDNLVLNLFAIIIFVGLLFFAHRHSIGDKLSAKLADATIYKRVKYILLGFILLLGVLWVTMTQFVPASDQLDVLDSAYKIRIGETNMVEPGGYLDRYSNQLGLVYIEYFLANIWGDFNIIGFQLLNAVGLALFYKKLADIMEKMGASALAVIATLFLGLLFFPLIMYTSFVYGTIWCMTLGMLAFYHELSFLQDFKLWRIPLCGIFASLAVQVKNNALIFIVAIIIYGLVFILKDRQQMIKILLLLIVTGLCLSIFSAIPAHIIKSKTGSTLDQGITSLAWVAMGLQEGVKAPGWWNAYNYYTYDENGCNTAAQEIVVKAEIAERIAAFKADKKYAFDFFSLKIASTWIEPTFQGVWVNQIRTHRTEFPAWIEYMMSAKGYTATAKFFSYFQLIIYLGALLWLALSDRAGFVTKSFMLMVFVGGFLFHIVWETKGQYSITYFVLLFPYAVMGYEAMVNKFARILDWAKTPAAILQKKQNVVATSIIVITIVAYFITYMAIAGGCLTAHTDTYGVYVDSWEAADTSESVRDIEIMKATYQGYSDYIIYLERTLQNNGIGY